MKNIKGRITAIIAAAAILVSGCGSSPAQETAPDESGVAAGADKIQIEIGYDGNEQTGEALRRIAAGFNTTQEEYEAVVDEQGGAWRENAENGQDGTEESGVSDESAGATQPDVENEQGGAGYQDAENVTASIIFTSDDVAAAYATNDIRLDLREYLKFDDDTCPLYDTIESLPVQMNKTVCDEDRGMYYLPVSVTAPVFYYNKTIYDALGLAVPQTFAGLGDNCAAIYAKNRIPGYLAYDLEGDIVAMVREQERFAESQGAAEARGAADSAESDAMGNADDAGQDATENIMTRAEVLQFFARNCESGSFRMVKHEEYAVLDFATGAVAAFAGTPADYAMATDGVTFEVGAVPWVMDREDAVYWVDTEGMLFIDQGEEKSEGTAAFAEYFLSSEVCSEYLEATGGISPYGSVYDSQAYRKNRRGFDEITMAVSDEIPRADFVLMTAEERRAADELLLYLMDGRVTAEDAARIMFD